MFVPEMPQCQRWMLFKIPLQMQGLRCGIVFLNTLEIYRASVPLSLDNYHYYYYYYYNHYFCHCYCY